MYSKHTILYNIYCIFKHIEYEYLKEYYKLEFVNIIQFQKKITNDLKCYILWATQ